MSHSKHEDISNPHYFGPGKWHTWHVEAVYAKTIDEQRYFIRFVRRQIDTLPCANCRSHAQTYIQQHPPDHFIGITTDKGPGTGMAFWLWMFHNAVNTRLGKELVSWDVGYSMYLDIISKPCSKTCQEAGSNPSEKSEEGTKSPLIYTNTPTFRLISTH